MIVKLPVIEGTGDAAVDKAIEQIVAAVTASLNWNVSGNCEFEASPGGFTLVIKHQAYTVSGVVQSGGITAAPSANKVGKGNVMMRRRTFDDNIVDDRIVVCYSNFTVAIVAGTRVEMEPDGDAFKLVGADCPTA